MKILITGGAGFIGSALIRHIIASSEDSVVNVDKLTYAGNLESLQEVSGSDRYRFEQIDVCAAAALERVFAEHRPDAVMHLAAESHVDRSIDGAAEFIQTNLVGTYTLLETARLYWQSLDSRRQAAFRLHHISTDEVYGDLDDSEALFTETSPYAPSSPYAATKAGSDHLVRAWQRTYGLPCIITNCSNNYGPYHYPEKLIPLTIRNCLKGLPLPVYGKGDQVRDWLYVEDHARALHLVIREARAGSTYNIGGHSEQVNLQVVQQICELLDELLPVTTGPVAKHADLITFVEDRPGHDRRYAIDASKIREDLGWIPEETFASGLRKTVNWFLANQDWCERVAGDAAPGDRLRQAGERGR